MVGSSPFLAGSRSEVKEMDVTTLGLMKASVSQGEPQHVNTGISIFSSHLYVGALYQINRLQFTLITR